MPPFTPFPLTPSELIYLNGEKYAKKHFVNNIKLMHMDLSVSSDELAHAMLSSAFLACEAEGVLNLQVGKQKRLIGSRDVIYALVTGTGAVWPNPSLEFRIVSLSQALAEQGNNTISGIVYALLNSDCTAPATEIIYLCKPYMAQRGLVIKGKKKALGFIPLTTYELPTTTVQGAAQFPMDRINRMLLTTQQTRPEVWRLLIDGIKRGIAQRVEQSSSDD